ncbi:hypothetical protein KIPB_009402, partial [Kipferlia bialata]
EYRAERAAEAKGSIMIRAATSSLRDKRDEDDDLVPMPKGPAKLTFSEWKESHRIKVEERDGVMAVSRPQGEAVGERERLRQEALRREAEDSIGEGDSEEEYRRQARAARYDVKRPVAPSRSKDTEMEEKEREGEGEQSEDSFDRYEAPSPERGGRAERGRERGYEDYRDRSRSPYQRRPSDRERERQREADNDWRDDEDSYERRERERDDREEARRAWEERQERESRVYNPDVLERRRERAKERQAKPKPGETEWDRVLGVLSVGFHRTPTTVTMP